MAIELEVLPDADAASRRAAEVVAAAGEDAVEARGEYMLALSGGKTPWAMIGILGEMEEMPWESTHIYQVDERVAPPGDEARNLTHLVQMLSLDHQSTLRPMPVTSRDLELSAAEYEVHVPENLDLVHLGLGPDGHTASLIPPSPPSPPRRRRGSCRRSRPGRRESRCRRQAAWQAVRAPSRPARARGFCAPPLAPGR